MTRLSLLAASVLVLLGGNGASAAETATMPLSDIKPGMKGTVYTVLQGTKIEPVEAEILGVAQNSLGPGHDLIIGKLVDPKTALVETVHGMSGSPLYIDGKLAGALSRRLTTFEKDGHCGFTPIGDMLQVDAIPSAPPADSAALLRSPVPLLPARAEGEAFAALDVPLSVNGLSPALEKGLLKAFGLDAGLVPVAGGGTGGGAASLTAADLQPGAAVAAALMTGDISIAGTGTLTWRDGDRVLGFGHPMMGVGRSSWAMAPAEIITTIPSYLMPYKLSNTGPVVGAIVEDRLSAIGGRIGAKPAMAAYRIERIHEGRALSPLQGEFSADPSVAPLLIASAAAGGVTGGNESGRTLFLRATGELRFAGGLPPLRLDGVFSGEDMEVEEALSALVAPAKVLYVQDWAQIRTTGLDLKLETSERLRLWTLDEARLDAPSCVPGGQVVVRLAVRERYGKTEERRVALTLPPGLKKGSVRIRVADGAMLDRASLLQAVPALDDAAQLIDLLNRRRSRDRLYVQVVSDAPGRVVADREMPALPPSVLAVMGAGHQAAPPEALSEQVWYETSVDLPGAVTGEAALPLDIRP